MKRIVALIGSRSGEDSSTKRLVDLFLASLLAHSYTPFQAEVITADRWGIGPCLSCSHCFYHGHCQQDEQDAMAAIRQKLLLADVIILGSPVFAAHVSGDAKTLIDRLSYWLHTLPLIGKCALTASTAYSNNLHTASDYLGARLAGMGAVVLGSLNAFSGHGDPCLEELSPGHIFFQGMVAEVAEILATKLPIVDPAQEWLFQARQQHFRRLKTLETEKNVARLGELQCWEAQGYFGFETMQDIINAKQAHEA